ncbi:MAG TPA: histidine kinase, partial [Cytophagaceae bacterium]|nr:histidine kinase [Cytophagaceae bacterium]
MRLNKKYIFHVFFWSGIYLLWIFVFRNYSFSLTRTLTIEFCYLIFITADFYIIAYFIIPRYLKKKKYLYFILYTLVLISLSALFRSLVSIQMNEYVFHNTQEINFSNLYINSFINIFIWVELISTGKLIIDRVHHQNQLVLLEKERVRNELDFLKAQINPHALFNSLNAIYGHIDKSNQTARTILLQFSELLRYQLYDCGEEKILLEKEIDYIKNYISFQQLRKDESLIVIVKIGPIASGFKIAPLLLVVLIENAFKFVSTSEEGDNKILIRLFTQGSVFHCSVFNTIERIESPFSVHTGGIGIANLKRRLELLYVNKFD